MEKRQETLDLLMRLRERALLSRVMEQGSGNTVIFKSEMDALERVITLVFDQEEEGDTYAEVLEEDYGSGGDSEE